MLDPYSNYEIKKSFVRIFNEDIESEDLLWHVDEFNRIITVISGTGWKLQFDNELPFLIEKNALYNVERETFHRLIKGNDQLILKIEEY